jgi:radical SAM protein with 4Fe4S-binding SPASM domain
MRQSLIIETHASSCYFRTTVAGSGRKALLQVTERCNLHCAHCFVSSGVRGRDMRVEDIAERVLPRLRQARVQRLTLTGGEPFVHPAILEIVTVAVEEGMPVGICTNATSTSEDQIAYLAGLGGVHVNVSFDGFRAASHGRFRGSTGSFAQTVATTRAFASAGLLQGLLSTPNMLTMPEEFAALCEFAVEIEAEYVLMNPLSSFGRGVRSQGRLAADEATMRAIDKLTQEFRPHLDVVHIRFPNDDRPLGGCDAGKIVYVFADGATAVCPYLVFAARTPQSRYPDTEFLVGNILTNDIAPSLNRYAFHDRYTVGSNPTCGSCGIADTCGKGCPAAVISAGGEIGDVDRAQCPPHRPLLQIGRAR